MVLSFLVGIGCHSLGTLLLGWFVAVAGVPGANSLVWPIGFPIVQNDRHSTMIRHDPCHHPGLTHRTVASGLSA